MKYLLARDSLGNRTEERGVLTGVLGACRSGRGRVILLEGRRRTGKTSLLAEAAREAARSGFLVSVGRCDEVRQLAPLVMAWEKLHDIEELAFPRTQDEWISSLKKLCRQLEERALRQPLLITLDDLHWADSATCQVLRRFSERLAGFPIVWALSRCVPVKNTCLDQLFDDLGGAGAVRLELGPLPDNVITEADLDDGRPHGLSPECWNLLQIAAVLGRAFSPGDVAELMCTGLVVVFPALQEALRASVIVPVDDGFVFKQHAVWQAALESVPHPVRKELHREVRDMLLSRGHSVETVADVPGWNRLSETQRAVAEHVSQGRTNREVAERMFLSPHTIAFHLRQIYGKLGITSRAELSRLVGASLGRSLGQVAVGMAADTGGTSR